MRKYERIGGTLSEIEKGEQKDIGATCNTGKGDRIGITMMVVIL